MAKKTKKEIEENETEGDGIKESEDIDEEDSEESNKGKKDKSKEDFEEAFEKLGEDFNKENFNNIQNLGFDSFMPKMESLDIKAPVLEKIAGQQGPKFISSQKTQGSGLRHGSETRDDDEFGYVSQQSQEDNLPKYAASEQINASPKRVDMRTVGRDTSQFKVPDQKTMHKTWAPDINSNTQHRESINLQPKKVDPIKRGREDFFEREQKKYQKYDPEKKSSY